MADSPFNLTLCGCQRGVFLVTPCGQAASGHCGRCGIAICADHAHSQNREWLCPTCYSSLAGDGFSDSGRSLSSDSYGSSSSMAAVAADDFAGEGGAFGGGGASSDWSDAAPSAGTAAAGQDLLAPFTDEDYAAFDAVSDFDKNGGGSHGYDS